MTHRPTMIGGMLMALLLAFGVAAAVHSTQPASPRAAAISTPDILQAGRCYRFVYWSQPSPNYKVLELLDAGWIKAEVDAGPASAQREPVWINIAQIIAIRIARCSA